MFEFKYIERVPLDLGESYISGLIFGKEVLVVFPKISTNPKIKSQK